MLAQSLQCPECGSSKVWKAGLRYSTFGEIQRYICRDCGFRFSDPGFSRKNDLNEDKQTVSRQICVLDEKAKNLVRAKKELALQENKNNTKSKLVNFSWYLKKDGRSEATIRTYTSRLKSLTKFCDLNDPEEVKGIIATKYRDNNTKILTCCAYDAYLQFVGGKWKKPNYKLEHKQVFIPTEEELRTALNTGQKESIVFSKFLYETGARANEAERFEWSDIITEKCKVSIKSSKGGLSRTLTVSEDLIKHLNSLPKTQNTVFARLSAYNRTTAFHERMKRLSKIHDNPRFEKIHLHTFRHCKALREYHKTKDLLHVMDVLGHTRIETTYRYVRLYKQIYGDSEPNKFITKIASTKEQRCEMINDGWDLVDKDGEDWYFRRPK